jgi:hypothetical protein
VWFRTTREIKATYDKTFKRNVIGEIVRFIDTNLIYEPGKKIKESDFMASYIFSFAHNIYVGDDYVLGDLGQTKIEFSELYSAFEGGGKARYHKKIFKGLFFIAEFNKNFLGKVLVLPDIAERFLGLVGRSMQALSSRGELIRLEDPEFERFFAVYSDDQVCARYVLSTALMERILEFRKKTGKRIRISFIDSKLYLAIPCRKDLFESGLFKSVLRFEPISEYFEDLQLIIGIVEDLNLNTRIWTKQ